MQGRGRDAVARARAGAVEGLRGRQAAVPPVHVGKSRDADGARGPGHRQLRPDGGLQGRRDRVREQEITAAVPGALTRAGRGRRGEAVPRSTTQIDSTVRLSWCTDSWPGPT